MDKKDMLRYLAGKTDPKDNTRWIPLWMHARDTAGIMEMLWQHWVPESLRRELCRGIGGTVKEYEGVYRKLCIFFGLIHDIGKVTAIFQARILDKLPGIREKILEGGLEIPSAIDFGSHVGTSSFSMPHALAGQILLQRLDMQEGICEIVGAHHGTPQDHLEKEMFFSYLVNLRGRDQDQESWESLWKEFLQYALEHSGFKDKEELPELSGTQRVLLSGLLIMADWVASNQYYFPTISVEENRKEEIYTERIQSGWKKLNLPTFWAPNLAGMGEKEFSERFGFFPNALQKAALETATSVENPGIFIMEAQMGIGKTEAALAAAEIFAGTGGSGGLFFGLPTQATANGIFPRIKNWAKEQSEYMEKLSIRLAHGKAELNQDYAVLLEEEGTKFLGEACIGEDEDKSLVVHSFFLGRKQVLLSDFVIATVDQILMAALKQKHLMLRHLGMAGKIIIIDECHAYDAYMSVYLERALCWLGAYHVPVILLSATLPERQRVAFIDAYLNTTKKEKRKRDETTCEEKTENWRNSRSYPLLTWTDGKDVHYKTFQVKTNHYSVQIRWVKDPERVITLREKLKDGGCAIVILSTIRRAQQFSIELQKEMPEYRIILLHSAFVMPDRVNREQELLKNLGKFSGKKERERLVIIGTSVLEQSLDIDGDFMMTDLCPMDLFLQRLGRLHRHLVHNEMRPKQLQQAQCFVIEAGDGGYESGSQAIYGEYLLMRTKKRLPAVIQLPSDIPDLVQDCYGDWEPTWENSAEEAEYERACVDQRRKRATKEEKAKTYRINKPRKSLEGWLSGVDINLGEETAQAQVRDSENSLEVLLFVKREDGIHYLPWQCGGDKVPIKYIPSKEEKRRILSQSVKLPGALSHSYKIRETLQDLNIMREMVLSGEWKQDIALREELFLLLDEKLEAEIAGFRLHYSEQEGLCCRKGTEDERTGI